ncbi:DUF4097 family beta strand repeat-containing protein [Catenuloplanes japonicus]|uniref:DUF4097 family beta strand repeat-containing protein n=1 Tax=Catenuloplanes japonicus TaxID=33876 RepID=UPI0005267A17|nr:DUF4097 family beta strand repeat-containing protein [Catenuloplanes japonicus]
MPVYQTPESIDVIIELSAGDIRVTAADRTDTVVEVRTSDENDASDVEAAGQIRVDYTDGTLRVTGPKRMFDFSRKTRSVEVTIALPTDSRLSGKVDAGDYRCTGRLGKSSLKLSAGNVRVERTGALHVDVSAGHVTADEIAGDADIHTGTGRVRIGAVGGGAVIKNSNGDTTVETVAGDLRVRSANGEIQVGNAGAGVDAKTSNGAIRLGRVNGGAITLASGNGDLDVGIAEGVAAWLEVNTGFGHVRNDLTSTSGPAGDGRTVEVRGRTAFGDVLIHRA